MAKAIARIFRGNTDQPVGVGFWVFPGCLLTCAHVVNQALGFKNETQGFPEGSLALDFPFSSCDDRFQAVVTQWFPVAMGAMGRDIAVLKLLARLPDDVIPMSLTESTGLPLVTKGYPSGYSAFNLSAELTIAVEAQANNGWVQLNNPGGLVTPGFSGAPVWEAQSENVVGMIVASAEAKQVAWMLSASVLRSVLGLPEMAGRSGKSTDSIRLTRTQKFAQGQLVLLESKLEAVEADLKTVQTSEERQAFYERARQLIQEIETLEEQMY